MSKFSLTATSTQFATVVAMLHSEQAVGTRITALLQGYADAASEFVRSNNRTSLEKILLSVRDKDTDGQKIKSGIRAGFDVYSKGYTPADFPSKKGGFKALSEEQQAPYINGHAAMVSAFETAMQGYGVKPVVSESVKAERKLAKEAKAAERLNESIKALGLVSPESIRPLDDQSVIGIVVDLCRAGMLSAAQLEQLRSEILAAIDIATMQAEKSKTTAKATAKAKAKATAKAVADKAAFDKEPPYTQAAMLAAVA